MLTFYISGLKEKIMKKLFVYMSLLTVSLISFSALPAVANESLYNRMGGYDVIAKFSVGLIDGFYADPAFIRFTEGGAPADVVERDKQLTAEYMCKITGGPCFYIGKDMLSVHKGLSITVKEWAALKAIAISVTADLNLEAGEEKEFLSLFEDIKGLMNIHSPPDGGSK